MAGDVAQFLRNKFLASLRETQSELSGAVLISYLRAIEVIVNDIDTRRLTEDYYRRFISVLLDLSDALTKCLVFSREWKKHSHHKNHWSLTKIYFVLKMKKRLAAIKRIFEDEFMKKEERIYYLKESSSSRPDPVENLESELPVMEPEVVGFDEQLRKIGKFLLKSSPSGAGFAAVGILGMAGAGKTTLVREFLSWWIVRGKFSPIIWLCLSNIIKEKKQVEEEIEVSIVKCMLSKLDHDAVVDGDAIIQEKEETVSSNNKSGHLLAALLERLNQHLSDKRYLIVLDDVWHMNDFYSDLGHRLNQLLQVQEGDKKVGDRLSHGLPKGSGGAVIVTSRIPEVVEAMVVPAEGSDQHYNSLIIPLEPLDRQSCRDIFKGTVFGYLPNFEYQQHFGKVESEIKDLCYGLPLAARTLAEIMSQNLGRTSSPYRKSEELLKLPDLDVEADSFAIPMLVFIDMYYNYRQEGEKLIGKFCDLLTKKQVFGVLLKDDSDFECKEAKTYNDPEMVLKDVYGTLEKLKLQGYYGFASEIQKKMRIIVVGRDAVVNWILGVICDLKLPESPSIAPVDLPEQLFGFQGIANWFGWRNILNILPLRSLLVDVALAKQMRTDSWHCVIRMNHRLPHLGNADNYRTLYRRFWNSLHLTVRRAYQSSIAIVKVLNHLGQWKMLDIPIRIESICCLNFPVFAHRVFPWVTEDGKTPSFIDDGRLEVIGSNSEYDFFARSGHWTPLDQVRGIRFEFMEGARGDARIIIDGVSPFGIPTKELFEIELVEIEISYHGQVNILASPYCAAKSIHHSSQYSSVSQANAKD